MTLKATMALCLDSSFIIIILASDVLFRYFSRRSQVDFFEPRYPRLQRTLPGRFLPNHFQIAVVAAVIECAGGKA
jgi:hypothetical protein